LKIFGFFEHRMNLEDIAKKAGVSRSTVSRVINNDRYVSADTRERVMRVIEEENFQPNPAARALVTRRTEIIGVVIPNTENIFFTDNSYFPMLLAGLGEATRQRDYALLLWLGELTNKDEHWIRKISSSRQADGLVIASLTHDHPLFPRLLEMHVPIVMIDRPLQFEDRINYVTIDNIHSAETAVEHLLAQGRRKIAHITGHVEISDGRDRLVGYQNALQKAGLPIDPNLIYYGKFTRTAGYHGMKYLLQHRPDAVFAAGDTIAVGALQAIHEAGLRVPEDIAIIGFDDIDVARQSNLTTMRQPVQQKGAIAAHLLIDLIEGKVQSPQHILLPTELVIRNTCGAANRQQQPTQLSANNHRNPVLKGGDAASSF
jgi:LacI family transcriptional regulator